MSRTDGTGSSLRRPLRRGAAAGVATLCVLGGTLAMGTSAAHAGPDFSGSDDEGSYGASVVVTFSGDYDPGKTGSVSRVPATCWWERVTEVDADDAEAFRDWFMDERSGFGPSSAGGGTHHDGQLDGGIDNLEEAIKADKEGNGVTWYRLQYLQTKDPETGYSNQSADMARLREAGCTTVRDKDHPILGEQPVSLRAFPVGEPPEPQIDVEGLRDAAERVLHLRQPTLQWNPRISAKGQAALIHLPTWLWVEDDKAASPLSVTASASGYSATVHAEPETVSISSPGGGTSCTAAEARTAYTGGGDESGACTLSFSRASTGNPDGFTVHSEVSWGARWTSSVGRGGLLDSQTMSADTQIRVAQSQALVTEVG